MRSIWKWKSSTWMTIGLVLAAFLVYSNVYENEFLYDDEFLIQKNRYLESWNFFGEIFSSSSTAGAGKTDSFFRPIQTLLYLFLYQLFGFSTAAFHFLNVVLHAINAVLVFVLGRRLGLGSAAGFLGALLWTVHPVHTEAVTYMSATADPLHAFFVLLGLVGMVPHFLTPSLIVGAVYFVMGLLSKEAAIVFPALMVACLFYLREQRWHWRTYLVTVPYWLVAALYLLSRKTFLNFADSFHFFKESNVYTESIYVRSLTFLATLPEYLKILFYPVDLHIDRNFPVFTSLSFAPVLLGLSLLCLSIGLLIRSCWGKGVFAAWVVLWFFAAHAPHAGILMPMNSLFLEHWLYLSSVSGFLAMGVLFTKIADSPVGKKGVGGMMTIILLLLGFRTWDQNRVWASPISLYSNILEFNPGAARVHNNLAMAYSAESDIAKAIVHYERAIEISDVYPESHHNLALAYLRVGQVDKAIGHLEKAVQMNPDFFFSYEYLAHAYEIKGNREKAAEYRRKFAETKQKFIR